jgi:hypothetical protein
LRHGVDSDPPSAPVGEPLPATRQAVWRMILESGASGCSWGYFEDQTPVIPVEMKVLVSQVLCTTSSAASSTGLAFSCLDITGARMLGRNQVEKDRPSEVTDELTFSPSYTKYKIELLKQ